MILLILDAGLAGALASTAQKNNAQTRRSAATLVYPNGLALDSHGDLYISDIGAHRIFKLEQRGGRLQLKVIAGNGEAGFSGDNGPAVKARLFGPHDLVFDIEGNLLIADTYNQRIRRIDRLGIITTIAGNGKAEYSGDQSQAVRAALNNPQGISVDREGNLMVADTYNHVIRRIDRNGVITTFAGSIPGFGGDGGPANKAQINLPMAVAVSPGGDLYLSDAANSRIRRIGADGIIRTIIGYGPAQDAYGAGFAGDGGPAEKAKVFSVTDLKFDRAGNLYFSDSGNHRIRVIRDGIITTVAGSGKLGLKGDKEKATAAELNTPQKIAVAADGSILIADRANHCVRKVDTRGFIDRITEAGKDPGMIFEQ